MYTNTRTYALTCAPYGYGLRIANTHGNADEGVRKHTHHWVPLSVAPFGDGVVKGTVFSGPHAYRFPAM